MDEEYKYIKTVAGGTIDDFVMELLSYNKRGELVSSDFNGHIFYSDTVNIEDAYKEITGSNKLEYFRKRNEIKEKYEKEKKEFEEQIPELIKTWIKKGRKILTEDKWAKWEEMVPFRLNDLYRGMELGCCLDIIKVLNNGGTLEEAKKVIYSQDHSGMSFALVCAMVKHLCLKGKEFAVFVMGE